MRRADTADPHLIVAKDSSPDLAAEKDDGAETPRKECQPWMAFPVPFCGSSPSS